MLSQPPAHAPDPMATVSMESGDIVWLSRTFWIDLDHTRGKPAMRLQQNWAPPWRVISTTQGLLVGFAWHGTPEQRHTDTRAADKMMFMLCRCDGKVCTAGCF